MTDDGRVDDQAEEPPPEWHTELVRLHVGAGRPSVRTLAGRTGISHTHVHVILQGRAFPSWPHLAALVTALGGRQKDFYYRWEDAATARLMARTGVRPAGTRHKDVQPDVTGLAAAVQQLASAVETLAKALESLRGP